MPTPMSLEAFKEFIKSLPNFEQIKLVSMHSKFPENAEDDAKRMLEKIKPKERKPTILLDENVAFANYPWDDAFPLKVVQRLKDKGIEATFVGDRRQFEVFERKMWARSPPEKALFQAMDKCHNEISFTGRYRDIDLKNEAQRNRAFKSCIVERSAVIGGSRITGFYQVPPRETSDAEIGKWSDDNGILVLSFDADPGLEGKELGDRIRLEQSQIECIAEGKQRPGMRMCDTQDEEADRLTNLIIKRMSRVRELLKGNF
jgi:hypothetical protein